MKLERELHTRYFLHNLQSLPEPYASQDVNRVVLAFFCVHGLAILGELDRVDKKQVIDWVYALQIPPDCNDKSVNDGDCGFRGGTWMGTKFHLPHDQYESQVFDTSNIAATYSALCILKTLGDDLGRVNKPAIIRSLRQLQNPDTGSFCSVRYGSEQDMRFVYCACAISHLLNDWSGVDGAGVVEYINSCLSFDGGIGISPGAESQGGAIFCAIGSLALSGRMLQLQCDPSDLVRWLLYRQHDGFQGRCNKDPDSCYAFWDGATLDLMGKHHLVDVGSCRDFVLSCQFTYGGFCKYPDTVPDVMHSYYSLAWLSIAANQTQHPSDDELLPLDTKLQIPAFR